MPPKPFNAPRPSTSASKPRPKPKPSKPTFSGSASKVTKPSSKLKDKGKGKEKERNVSGNGGGFRLPSLSPDSDVQMVDEDEDDEEGEEQEEEEEDGDEQELSDLSNDDEDDELPSRPSKSGSKSKQPRTSVPGNLSDDEEEDPANPEPKLKIPPKLLTVLLQTHFAAHNAGAAKKGKTRINLEASEAVGKYIDVFVREAMARAAYVGAGGEGEVGNGGVLEVESLERICPQLLLDF